MRVSTSLQYETYISDLDTAQNRVYAAQQQETTGLAINVPSDNPAGEAQLINMNALGNQLTQYQSNLSQAKGILAMTDSSLSTVGNILQSANQIGLQAASGTTDTATEQSLAAQITALQQQLVSAGNAQGPNGEYLFAGQQTGAQPFSVDSTGALNYAGDSGSVQIEGGPSDSITVNVPGSPLFTDAYNQLQTLKNDIQSGNTSNISNTDLAGLQSSQTAFSEAQGVLGARADTVASLTTDNTRRITNLESQVSNLADMNTATAVTNYTQAQTAYQAALEVVSQASTSMSLVDYIAGK